MSLCTCLICLIPCLCASQPLLEKLHAAERFDEIRRVHRRKIDIQLTREWLFENYCGGTVKE